jgi:hypothetical protein
MFCFLKCKRIETGAIDMVEIEVTDISLHPEKVSLGEKDVGLLAVFFQTEWDEIDIQLAGVAAQQKFWETI